MSSTQISAHKLKYKLWVHHLMFSLTVLFKPNKSTRQLDLGESLHFCLQLLIHVSQEIRFLKHKKLADRLTCYSTSFWGVYVIKTSWEWKQFLIRYCYWESIACDYNTFRTSGSSSKRHQTDWRRYGGSQWKQTSDN